jgi:hypothetical protein
MVRKSAWQERGAPAPWRQASSLPVMAASCRQFQKGRFPRSARNTGLEARRTGRLEARLHR